MCLAPLIWQNGSDRHSGTVLNFVQLNIGLTIVEKICSKQVSALSMHDRV